MPARRGNTRMPEGGGRKGLRAVFGGLLFLALLLALLFVGLCARAQSNADAPDEAQAIALKAAAALNLQTELPAPQSPTDKAAPSGPSAAQTDPPFAWLSRWSLSPDVARAIIWSVTGVFLVVMLLVLRDSLWSASRSRRLRREEERGTDPSAASAAARAARMDKARDEAEDLAARGDFAGAMHLLLLRSVHEVRRQLDLNIAVSLTSREILRLINLPAEGRDSFADIIGRVEVSWFGSHQPGEADYQACCRAFAALARSLSRAAPAGGERA